MKKVIVACGGAIATSTIAGQKVKELSSRINIPVEMFRPVIWTSHISLIPIHF